MRWILSLPVWLSLIACAGSQTQVETPPVPDLPDPEPQAPGLRTDLPLASLSPTWKTCGAWDFERMALDQGPRRWDPESRDELAAELQGQDQTAVRAAVLLAWGSSESHGLLLAELELRMPVPERNGDAALIVAAAALASSAAPAGAAERLVALSMGQPSPSIPHPDLEVRVECAAAALSRGQTAVIPFLLRVLHAGTPAEIKDPIDWAFTDKLAWSKSRAAESLSRRAGLPCRFQPDGSFANQMDEARVLEAALQLPD
ncbi:MAG: hypothetical protein ACI8X5_000369 [Planctomycetota bacterium]|jgi:hypothetical protein